MSNQAVVSHHLQGMLAAYCLETDALKGEVYQRIIQEVCDVSLIDFEEAGVSAATLEELRLVSCGS